MEIKNILSRVMTHPTFPPPPHRTRDGVGTHRHVWWWEEGGGGEGGIFYFLSRITEG